MKGRFHPDGSGPHQRHGARAAGRRRADHSLQFILSCSLQASRLRRWRQATRSWSSRRSRHRCRPCAWRAHRRRISAGRVQRGHRQRARNRRCAGRASGGGEDCADRQRRCRARAVMAQRIRVRSSRVLLELGGKNALIAFADADPVAVAEAMIAGMNFAWCGQSCGSCSRAFLHASIHDRVLDALKTRIGAFRPGRPDHWGYDDGRDHQPCAVRPDTRVHRFGEE